MHRWFVLVNSVELVDNTMEQARLNRGLIIEAGGVKSAGGEVIACRCVSSEIFSKASSIRTARSGRSRLMDNEWGILIGLLTPFNHSKIAHLKRLTVQIFLDRRFTARGKASTHRKLERKPHRRHPVTLSGTVPFPKHHHIFIPFLSSCPAAKTIHTEAPITNVPWHC